MVDKPVKSDLVTAVKIITVIITIVSWAFHYSISLIPSWVPSFSDGKLGKFLIVFVLVNHVPILLLSGSFLMILNKKYGWILPVSAVLSVIGLIIIYIVSYFVKSGENADAGIFVGFLAGFFCLLYLVILFPSEVRNRFNSKKNELATAIIIAIFCRTAAYFI